MNKILQLAEANQKRAHQVIEDSGVIEAWQSIGATINLIGSLKMGLLMKHRDIDFHIYNDKFSIVESFSAITKLAANPNIRRVSYTNLLEAEDGCIEWHAWYEDEQGNEWQLDMMHILKGSPYDGYFEKVAERIMAVITPEQRLAILTLKFHTPDEVKIMGIEYYLAVIRDGIRNYDEFLRWREKNHLPAIIEWLP